ncbi:hypothetical protein C8F04DRAFT_329083 [Mycena alexandri]|uniref:Glucose-methanol-choline oxidoreductase N-terminal domain-containing protein n=1 Tax=Mycena alexandri TaxID=1745969 RepID=A0AAD6S2D2_9AGAR|nr:hypothetical protein C8F04DRAFT_329083 [Mycena alexandri]
MLSGIGPATQLAQHNITLVQDLPGVGANLQDRIEMTVIWAMKKNDTLHRLYVQGQHVERPMLARMVDWRSLKCLLLRHGPDGMFHSLVADGVGETQDRRFGRMSTAPTRRWSILMSGQCGVLARSVVTSKVTLKSLQKRPKTTSTMLFSKRIPHQKAGSASLAPILKTC